MNPTSRFVTHSLVQVEACTSTSRGLKHQCQYSSVGVSEHIGHGEAIQPGFLSFQEENGSRPGRSEIH